MTHRRSRGFSLIEMLTVIAIIGILSLVTVPPFIQYQRRNLVRSALREFTTVLRKARSEAIDQSCWIRVQAVGTPGREYQTFLSRDGVTWSPYSLMRAKSRYNRAWLPQTVEFKEVTFTDKAVDFKYDGTVDETGTFKMNTDWPHIINEITIDVSVAGQIKSTEKTAS